VETDVAVEDLAAVLLSNAQDAIHVRVPGETSADVFAAGFVRIARITVVFGGFRDGRGFSLGQTLRERGYTGELVASGEVIADHAPMLARCGFDAVELPTGAVIGDWEGALASFSAVYQSASDGVTTVWAKREAARAAVKKVADAQALAVELNAKYRDASAEEIVRAAVSRFPGRIATLSSFGTEAAVGLHILSRVARDTPVLFLDTDRHFAPTLSYRDQLTKKLGLTDLRTLTPQAAETNDPRGDLWRTNPDACCSLRKVQPLAAVAPQFDALITGRKRFHGGARVRLPVFEAVGAQIRVNPLANWSSEAIEAHLEVYDLPRHPLTQGGYRSVGCWPCTQPSAEEENIRAGRWRGLEKSECGIHMPERWVAA
jgi:phosphoadenylyl-sulfate reductase (thioredoxin)